MVKEEVLQLFRKRHAFSETGTINLDALETVVWGLLRETPWLEPDSIISIPSVFGAEIEISRLW
ncbi:hypothetical protein Trco_003438 [Trichoderma cornu-damae]|uniref:Uncharacterized protein n=1 Tax=Trichoderma cornu-damae TaxID=654480 RepID=A0A9P8QPD2_9HYPO|nr:hypothetical protein Trco_003438 [Trichoderma cornu-damae]